MPRQDRTVRPYAAGATDPASLRWADQTAQEVHRALRALPESGYSLGARADDLAVAFPGDSDV
eukprot:6577783-Alexandrium_andersonii.AAC.1